MIFVSLGSREYQFDRLLKKLDELVEDDVISEPIFAQIGQSTYTPQNYDYERFIDSDKFSNKQDQADLIISHGGTGALIGAIKKGKQVIAVPRLAKYGEHIDDHQTQVSSVLDEMGYLKSVQNMDQLGSVYLSMKENPISKKYDRPSNVLEIINEFIG
ncbi:PssE/Cps14G family polysaccharide biosynthesis glycosyltransferase [Aerococcus kribbianus]|uniref:Glycosyltransferase n=1 Tax=Aerococcus kribbianus TaxID=2999064 RepID=A0A9X3FMF8_9LACT|nr:MULTISPECIES: PssE/Cps14G family polysaccharide biosynthesis glycosyltransferase [unclassified Aerococcus]MCZ0717180.1 glycosyltransferase [Aerococcus sp. YH-aer221]MCZ0725468.1 glycosyltransferase [Aerococcus sp. YH-aer222]